MELSSRQTLLRKNFPDEVRKSFPRHWTFRKQQTNITGNFSDCPETFQIVIKLFRTSGNFPNCLETSQTVWHISRLVGNLPNCPTTLQTVRELYRPSGKFPDCPAYSQNCPKSFQTDPKKSGCSAYFHSVWTLSRLSGHFPDCLEIFQIVQKGFIQSENFPEVSEAQKFRSKIFLNGSIQQKKKQIQIFWPRLVLSEAYPAYASFASLPYC